MLNVNQVNQLYFVGEVVNSTPSALGELQVCANVRNNTPEMMYFKHFGKGGLVRTDLVPLKVVFGSHDLRVTLTPATDNDVKMNYATFGVNPAVDTNSEEIYAVAGEEYVLRVSLPHLYDMGDESIYTKYAYAKATASSTVSDINKALAISLYNGLGRNEKDTIMNIYLIDDTHAAFLVNKANIDDDFNTAGASGTYEGILIEGVRQPWELGLMPETLIDFEVSADSIIIDGVETNDWFKYTKNGLVHDSDLDLSGTTLGGSAYTPQVYPNSRKVADLEYFLMGERGDQYRMVNYPNYVRTNYMVDPTYPSGYDIVTVHYSFIGHNEDNKRGEKDLTFICPSSEAPRTRNDEPTSVAEDLYDAIMALIAFAETNGQSHDEPPYEPDGPIGPNSK